MSKNTDIEEAPVPAIAQEPGSDTGVIATLKHAKDYLMDKAAHPKETASELKDWAERSAQQVDVALEKTQGALAAVHDSIGDARGWTAAKAVQMDRTLAQVQSIVQKLDDTVEVVQESTKSVAESLGESPVIGCDLPDAKAA